MFKLRGSCVAALAALAAVPGLMTIAAVPAAASPTPYTVALITSITGPAAPQDVGTVGAFEARLDLQNAQGGIHGHKLVPLILDDQTNPAQISTEVQEAIAKGAIGIVSESPLLFLAAKYTAQAGIPVTGDDSDGPEWGKRPYTNTFAAVYGSLNPSYPVNTMYGKLLKAFGATKLATYAIGISPDSVRANSDVEQSFARFGGKTVVNDTSVPFGSVNFTSLALTAKQNGADALWPNLDSASDVAVTEAYEQAGIKTKAVILPAGLSSSLLTSPAWPQLKGVIFLDEVRPFQVPDAGTKAMQAALEKYDHYTSKDFPNFSESNAWLGADLMMKGMAAAGSNPTRASVVKALRNIKSYNGNGLLANTINFSTVFGHDLPICVWALRAEQTGFVPIRDTPYCGTDIPGTKASAKTSS
jgi:branched-chain amino acid transport system substrate-binding protein